MKTFYSLSDDDFCFESVDEVIDQLEADGELFLGRGYYECDFKQIESSQIVSAESVLEDIGNTIYDLVGDRADDATTLSQAAIANLQSALNDWCDAHIQPQKYWTAVGALRERVITSADLRT